MIELPGTCKICNEKQENLIAHLEILHPDACGDGFLKWPDGSAVIVDSTLQPGDFS